MAIVTLEEVKDQLSFTDDMGSIDDALLTRKVAAAQDHVENLLGFKIEDTYGGQDQDPVPPSLMEAVSQLAAWWYENRETVNVGNIATEVPFGVMNIVNEHREWSF